MRIAEALQAAGFDVRGIRPPTVPLGTSRLRISLSLNVNEEDVSALGARSEEHTSELQSLMRISYAVFCLKKKNIELFILTDQTFIHVLHREGVVLQLGALLEAAP